MSLSKLGIASMVYEYYAPEYFKTKDPFYIDDNGKKRRRKPPAGITANEEKAWKNVIKKAWVHDKNCFGCTGFDLGCGIVTVLSIIPFIGPLLGYTIQSSLVAVCAKQGLPLKEQAKMGGNITATVIIAMVPLLGTLFCWLYGCSTRNAAIYDTWLIKQGREHMENQPIEHPGQSAHPGHPIGQGPQSRANPSNPYPESWPQSSNSMQPHMQPPMQAQIQTPESQEERDMEQAIQNSINDMGGRRS